MKRRLDLVAAYFSQRFDASRREEVEGVYYLLVCVQTQYNTDKPIPARKCILTGTKLDDTRTRTQTHMPGRAKRQPMHHIYRRRSKPDRSCHVMSCHVITNRTESNQIKSKSPQDNQSSAYVLNRAASASSCSSPALSPSPSLSLSPSSRSTIRFPLRPMRALSEPGSLTSKTSRGMGDTRRKA
jgi:hypothetical protein